MDYSDITKVLDDLITELYNIVELCEDEVHIEEVISKLESQSGVVDTLISDIKTAQEEN